MDCINARNCIFSKQKAEKNFREGSQLSLQTPPYWEGDTLPGYSLTPQEKGKVGAYDNLILYQEHALKKALILLYGFIAFIALTILELLAFNRW